MIASRQCSNTIPASSSASTPSPSGPRWRMSGSAHGTARLRPSVSRLTPIPHIQPVFSLTRNNERRASRRRRRSAAHMPLGVRAKRADYFWMKRQLMDLLVCPDCEGELELHDEQLVGEEVAQ